MTPDHTLMVDSNVRDSNLTHSQFTSQKIKDAIHEMVYGEEILNVKVSVYLAEKLIFHL